MTTGPEPETVAAWRAWVDAHEAFLASVDALAAGAAAHAAPPPRLPQPAGELPAALRPRVQILAARWPQVQQDLAHALAAATPRRTYAARGRPGRFAPAASTRTRHTL